MSFFKAYDMRGTFGTDFDLDLVARIGRALPQVVPGSRWLVGRDTRTTSPDVSARLVAGLAAAGAEVTDLGLCSTPMVYWWTAEGGFDGSVMVTASHNPPSDNGLKVSRRNAVPVGYADGLDRVERLVAADTAPLPPPAKGQILPDALPRYFEALKRLSPLPSTSSLRYAVDCSNGMASLLVRELFPGAVVINDTLDGSFPNHSPNPLKAEAREQLARLVREKGLDCGVIFDGDADRCMFVDEHGDFIQPDYLIPLVAEATRDCEICNLKSEIVIHDVRTSRGAIEALKARGFTPLMVPVGHAFAKPVMREKGALAGGELAGHYYFGDFFCCDSGALAARRILGRIAAAKACGRSFSELMRPISGKWANSGELNFRVEDKDAAIARILAAAAAQLPQERGRETMDGIRLEYDEGWLNVRKSNTEPYLRLLIECDTPARLAFWRAILESAIEG